MGSRFLGLIVRTMRSDKGEGFRRVRASRGLRARVGIGRRWRRSVHRRTEGPCTDMVSNVNLGIYCGGY